MLIFEREYARFDRSRIERFGHRWDFGKALGVYPGCFRKSAQVLGNAGDGGIQILGVRKRLKRLGMRTRLDSLLVRSFPIWEERREWKEVERRITKHGSTILSSSQ